MHQPPTERPSNLALRICSRCRGIDFSWSEFLGFYCVHCYGHQHETFTRR